ncbi:MAG TPA: hypothetical protein DEH00_04130 [Candidatus Marinimicrobia bacterium]|nr:hypothetical protein [Candidatus Neomarinimicrobiota bacterium]
MVLLQRPSSRVRCAVCSVLRLYEKSP